VRKIKQAIITHTRLGRKQKCALVVFKVNQTQTKIRNVDKLSYQCAYQTTGRLGMPSTPAVFHVMSQWFLEATDPM